MAKSIRSKVKRKFRAIKRDQVFAPVEAKRLNKLVENQEKHLVELEQQQQQKNNTENEIISDSMVVEASGAANTESAMEVDSRRVRVSGKEKYKKRNYSASGKNIRRKTKTSTTFW